MDVEGYWGKDTVKLQTDSSSLVVDEFEFFVITSLDSEDFRSDFDGILGLGAPPSSNNDAPSTRYV